MEVCCSFERGKKRKLSVHADCFVSLQALDLMPNLGRE